jgi:AcrR family transcriptional regulator
MGNSVATAKGSKQAAGRVGRPPQALAGEVDERILKAARRVFLERGLAGASIDEIARLARAGKPTIYARFATKEALFTAVGLRNSADIIGGFGSRPVTGATIEQRLVSVGTNILEQLLAGDAIDFIRLAVAESRRFPDVADIGRIARERGAQAVAEVLSDVAHSDEVGTFPAFAPAQLPATTQFFIDLVTSRCFIRALLGEDLNVLRAEIDSHVPRAVAFFLTACRHSSN